MEASELLIIEGKIPHDVDGREKGAGWRVKDGYFRPERPKMSLSAYASRNDTRFGAYEWPRLARSYLLTSAVKSEFSGKGGAPTRIVYRLSWGDVVWESGNHSELLLLWYCVIHTCRATSSVTQHISFRGSRAEPLKQEIDECNEKP
jgi:hypothetical protein